MRRLVVGFAAMPPLNFRDVGECISIILDEPSPVPPGVLYRGGKFDWLDRVEDLGRPRTIVNLRRGPDLKHLEGVRLLHVPAQNVVENYETYRPEVRAWVRRAIETIIDPKNDLPIYVHCASGRDRTGIVIAAILLVLGVPQDVIIEEYLLSNEVAPATIEQALDGLREAELPDRASVARAFKR
jgi:protein-tyrosine phosphatase